MYAGEIFEFFICRSYGQDQKIFRRIKELASIKKTSSRCNFVDLSSRSEAVPDMRIHILTAFDRVDVAFFVDIKLQIDIKTGHYIRLAVPVSE